MIRGSELYSYKMLRGSEHQIGGRPFPLELHLVHFNSKYGEIGENLFGPKFYEILMSSNYLFFESQFH